MRHLSGLCLFLLAILAGCGGAATPCSYNGKSYKTGDTFPSSDGCNSCACAADGAVSCTEIACVRECSYDGKTYAPGQSFPSSDGCNVCGCAADGAVACTLRACSDQCVYDGGRYNPGDSFPASDGCNTCTCQQGGQVGCTKIACQSTQWLSLRPVQCQGNPWEKVTPKGDGTEPKYRVPELLTIDRFFRDQSIGLQELGLLQTTPPSGTCDACNCARGDRLLVRARSSDVASLSRLYGFTVLGAAEALALVPRQCSNPWSPAATPKEEAANVATWAASVSAPVKEAGFVYPTKDVAVCSACSCPRGDRLAVYPKDAAAAEALRKRGFMALQ